MKKKKSFHPINIIRTSYSISYSRIGPLLLPWHAVDEKKKKNRRHCPVKPMREAGLPLFAVSHTEKCLARLIYVKRCHENIFGHWAFIDDAWVTIISFIVQMLMGTRGFSTLVLLLTYLTIGPGLWISISLTGLWSGLNVGYGNDTACHGKSSII